MHNETRVIVTNKQMRELVPKKINPTRRFTTEKRAIAISIMDNDCDEIDGDLIFGPNPPPLLVCVCVDIMRGTFPLHYETTVTIA